MNLIPVPDDVAQCAAAALQRRYERGHGGTARGVAIASALATGVITEHERDELTVWHAEHSEQVQEGMSTTLAGLYGGWAARVEWPPSRVARTAAARTPLADKLARLSSTVNDADRRLLTKLHAGAQVAFVEALRQAEQKIVLRGKRNAKAAAAVRAANGNLSPALLAAVGVSEQELLDRRFDAYGATAIAWIAASERRKVRAAARAAGLDPNETEREYADEIDRRAAAASLFLVAALGTLARAALSGHTVTPETARGEFAGPVPFGIVRTAVDAAASGRPTPGIDDSGPGPADVDALTARAAETARTLVTEILNEAGIDSSLRYTWAVGDPERPFDPHQALDGVEFSDFDDPQLENNDGWPDFTHFFPSDHPGCLCLAVGSYDVGDSGGTLSGIGAEEAAL